MALENVIELGDGSVRIGFNAEEGQVQILLDDELDETFDQDDLMPPCCLLCIEIGHWVEQDGSCPHGKLAYTRKVGLI